MYQTLKNDGALNRRLRLERVHAMFQQAEIIRDYAPGDERDEEARKHVMAAQIERTLGNITADEERRLFTILSFVMPQDATREGDHAPVDADEPDPHGPPNGIPPDLACHLGCPSCEGGRMEPQ